ncbi:MAG: hypothetical protein L3J46_07570 [Kangiellaceae bacterium]|nr:hypothetical protein [Kangiellaceae bacterium]
MTNFVLELDDSRRLTGPNLFGSKAGAIIDVKIKNFDADKIIQIWQEQVKMLLDKVGWQKESACSRKFEGGASLVITAPIDCLYAATEVNETAWQLAVNQIQEHKTKYNSEPPIENLDDIISSLLKEIADEENPALIKIYNTALIHNVAFLSDDDEVSIGYGKSCQIFPVDNIPDVNSIDWQQIKDIPVALVTGTNGKSTTVRLASAVVKAAGKRCGITSTDYIRVGNKILDRGDYSGPGGARTLLRHPETEVAFLEVARGGMLRRGIGINQARAALITNVSEDHLGEYGINTLDDMVEAKFIVRQCISKEQNLILNADDAGCVRFAKTLDNTIVWFAWSEDNSVIQNHLGVNGTACYVKDDSIYYCSDGIEQLIIVVNDIPCTFGGAAKHNIHNALAVVALSFSLGLELKDIVLGLSQFSSTPEDNPGRGNLFEIQGFRVILDFAHNEHGLSLMAQTINNIPANRRLVMLGQAGDRTDELIEGLFQSALQANPDVLLVCELEGHLRGRNLKEVPEIIHNFALKHGLKENQIIHVPDTIEGTNWALNWAQPEDLMLILGLDKREEIVELLESTQQS